MIETIRRAWGWTGLAPAEILAANSFGNLIVCATDGAIWRICPEEWSCARIALNRDEFTSLSIKDEFQRDWDMSSLVLLAKNELGLPAEGQCYCLKTPAVIGGSYDTSNLGVIGLQELICFSGEMAAKTKELPDGAQVLIEVVSRHDSNQ